MSAGQPVEVTGPALRGLPRRLVCAVTGHRPEVRRLDGRVLVTSCARCHQPTGFTVLPAAVSSPHERVLAAVAAMTAALGAEATRTADVYGVLASVPPADLPVVAGAMALTGAAAMADDGHARRFLQLLGLSLAGGSGGQR